MTDKNTTTPKIKAALETAAWSLVALGERACAADRAGVDRRRVVVMDQPEISALVDAIAEELAAARDAGRADVQGMMRTIDPNLVARLEQLAPFDCVTTNGDGKATLHQLGADVPSAVCSSPQVAYVLQDAILAALAGRQPTPLDAILAVQADLEARASAAEAKIRESDRRHVIERANAELWGMMRVLQAANALRVPADEVPSRGTIEWLLLSHEGFRMMERLLEATDRIAGAPWSTKEPIASPTQLLLALHNCRALATAKLHNPARKGDWADVLRFCAAAGVSGSILRDAQAAAQAAATPAAVPLKRYFKVESPGPSWTLVASGPRQAWQQWLAWHEACGSGDAMEDEFVMRELPADQVANTVVDDDGRQRPLADLELGATLCSEY